MAAQTQTVISGSDGNLAFVALNSGNVPQGKFQSWSLALYQVINNITGFDSSGFMEFLGGCKGAGWSATLHHKFNAATSSPFGGTTAADIMPKSGATATFTVATGCTIGWGAIIQNHNIVQDVTGDSVSSMSGPCSGTPTLAWDET
jgi:hypothetical protein